MVSRSYAILLAAIVACAIAPAHAIAAEQANPARAAGDAGPAGSFLRADDARVAEISYRLALAGAAHCPARYPLSGLAFHHLREYRADDRPALIAAYRLDLGIGILAVIGASPAAQAGLRAGDVIVRINGETVRAAPIAGAPAPAAAWRGPIEAGEDQLEDALRIGPVRLSVLRDGSDVVPITLTSRSGCPARARLARSGQSNAFATGRHVILTTATLAFTGNDDELAVVLGHELAHVILGHPQRLEREGVPKGLLRGFGKNAGRIRATEEEADRLGLRLAWAAGYDVTAAIPFWRRYYARFDGPQLFRTHPSLAARERLIAATLAELQLGAQRPEFGKGALRQR